MRAWLPLRVLVRHRERERLAQLGDGTVKPLLTVILVEEVPLRRREERNDCLRPLRYDWPVVEPVAHLELRPHEGDGSQAGRWLAVRVC